MVVNFFHFRLLCCCCYNGSGYCFPKSKLKSSHFPKSIRQKFRGQGMRMTDQTRVFRILFMTFMYTFQRERDRRLSVNFHFQVSTRIFSFCESTPEPWYSEPRYSEILYIVNKSQLPLWDFIEILCLDIVNDLI